MAVVPTNLPVFDKVPSEGVAGVEPRVAQSDKCTEIKVNHEYSR